MSDDESPGRPLEIRWTERARSDLAAIADYIAADDPAAAKRWCERLVANVERIAAVPWAGRIVPEYPDRRNVREVIDRRYRIVYRVLAGAIEVLTIFEGHRRFPGDAMTDVSADEG